MIELSNQSYRRAQRGRRRLIITTVVIILIALLDVVSGGTVRSYARLVASSVYAAGGRISTRIGVSGFFQSRGRLLEENHELKQDLTRLQDRVALNALLTRENEELRELAHLAANTPGMSATVVSSPRSSPFGTFLISVGPGQGVAPGDIVMSEGGFVIGRVAEVTGRVALVGELFAPHATVDAQLGGASVLAEGQGGGNARLRLPHGIQVAVGDVLTSPEVGSLAIGVVGRVLSDPAGAYTEVFVRLPTNLLSLQYVYVATRTP